MKELAIAKMRYVIAICLVLASAAMQMGVVAQTYGTIIDTLVVVENPDTIYLYPGGVPLTGAAGEGESKTFADPGSVSAVFEADSISGSTGATLVIEVSDGEYSPFLWFPVATTVIDGPGKTLYMWTDEFFADRKWRAKIISSAGVQQIGITCQWTFKPLRR